MDFSPYCSKIQQCIKARPHMGPWYRISRRKHASTPLGVKSTTAHRFNNPNQTYGVLYLGSSVRCSVLENIVRDHKAVPKSIIEDRIVFRLSFRDDVDHHLIDLREIPLSQLGFSANSIVESGGDYDQFQRFSKYVFEQHPEVAGILYPSRFDPQGQCIALFGRSDDYFEELLNIEEFQDGSNWMLIIQSDEAMETLANSVSILDPNKAHDVSDRLSGQ